MDEEEQAALTFHLDEWDFLYVLFFTLNKIRGCFKYLD
jgi:hypothetical protein